MNGNRRHLVTQVTIRGPLLLAPALHVVQVQVGQICNVGVLLVFWKLHAPRRYIFARFGGWPPVLSRSWLSRSSFVALFPCCLLPGGFSTFDQAGAFVGDSFSRLLRTPSWRVSFQDMWRDLGRSLISWIGETRAADIYIPWFSRSLTLFVGYIAPRIFGRGPLAAALSAVTVESSRALTRFAPVWVDLQQN